MPRYFVGVTASWWGEIDAENEELAEEYAMNDSQAAHAYISGEWTIETKILETEEIEKEEDGE
jgi:hypothetical protein